MQHVQIIVHAGTVDVARLEAAITAAYAAEVPLGCTRTVFLVYAGR